MAVSAKPSRRFCADDFRAAIAFMWQFLRFTSSARTVMGGRMKNREGIRRDADHAV
jgi:hypothetical protein